MLRTCQPPLSDTAMPLIRPSQDRDIPAITAIYAHHVLHGTASFEIDPPARPTCGARAEVLPGSCLAGREDAARSSASPMPTGSSRARLPLLAGRFDLPRAAGAAPRPGARAAGRTGDALREPGHSQADRDHRRLGQHRLHRVHSALGFAPVGVLKSCGWKFGKWLDVVMMEKTLGRARAPRRSRDSPDASPRPDNAPP